jgi:hypothetical protein
MSPRFHRLVVQSRDQLASVNPKVGGVTTLFHGDFIFAPGASTAHYRTLTRTPVSAVPTTISVIANWMMPNWRSRNPSVINTAPTANTMPNPPFIPCHRVIAKNMASAKISKHSDRTLNWNRGCDLFGLSNRHAAIEEIKTTRMETAA